MSGSAIDELRLGLEQAMSRDQAGKVEGLQRLSAGASQEIWAFDFVPEKGEREPLILRRAPENQTLGDFSIPMEIEAKTIEHVYRHGVAVPPVRYRLLHEDGIGEGYIMERVPGETLPPRIMHKPEFAKARNRFAEDAGRALARLHAVPLEGLNLPEYSPATFVAELNAIYTRNDIPNPVFAMSLKWLEDNLPDYSRRCLVHGDMRLGNVMLGEEGLRAILDWELAHVGDPIEDLGWLTINSWRFGNIDLEAGGLGTREALIEAYEAESGAKVDLHAFRFWQVCGSLRWGILCSTMVAKVANGEDRTPERAVIARRASENEIDLLDLLLPLEGPHA